MASKILQKLENINYILNLCVLKQLFMYRIIFESKNIDRFRSP